MIGDRSQTTTPRWHDGHAAGELPPELNVVTSHAIRAVLGGLAAIGAVVELVETRRSRTAPNQGRETRP